MKNLQVKNNMENIYIISDVHGCYKTLLALIEQFPNKQKSKIVFVGDLVDKGKNSCEVIEFIMSNKYDCVMGNHEELFLEYAPNKDEFGDRNFNMEYSPYYFEKCGGKETIESYKNNKEIYCKHYEFIQKLPLYIEYQDYRTTDDRYLVVSHSTVGKVWNIRNSTNKNDVEEFNHFVKWSRWKNHDNEEIFNVYGHTIFQEPLLNDYSCGIDLGCFYKNKEKLPNPRLCALEFPSMKIYTQESLED